MSESCMLSNVAELLRPVSGEVFKGKGKLCLSTLYLQKLNEAFDEHTPEELALSFHTTDSKASLQRDLQFLLDLINRTIALKIIPDLTEVSLRETGLSLRRFDKLKALEIDKVPIDNIIGIQKLRSQLHELSSSHNLSNLGDVLDRCGGDGSQASLWSELKKANFAHNRIEELDSSLELTPWLVTLDLSHNHLSSVEFNNCLPNLKNLNISFNKLDKVPRFKGQICKRLQVLIISNNFIEDLSGLNALTSLVQLDLSRNCVVQPGVLLSVAHLASLSVLNLQGNPISFHAHHRNVTCQYLNKNTATLNFVLDNVALTKMEKLLAGHYHSITSSLGSSNESSMNSLEASLRERHRKVRNVTIEEGDNVVVEPKKTPTLTPPRSSGHLEMKKQVEQLRQEYGDSWLYRHSGVIFQDVLGFAKSTVLSSTPSSAQDVPIVAQEVNDSTLFETAVDHLPEDESKDFITAEENDFFADTTEDANQEDTFSDNDENEGEAFYVSKDLDSEETNFCVIVTQNFLSERDSVTTRETARWNVNTMLSCEAGQLPNEVKIIFDTVRADRKSRTYLVKEAERFIHFLQAKIQGAPKERISYQCMKCGESFTRTKLKARKTLNDDDIPCPQCQSLHIIETNRESS